MFWGEWHLHRVIFRSNLPSSSVPASQLDISNIESWLFLAFGLVITAFLVIDLGFLSRTAKVVTTRSALIQSSVWVGISVLFGMGIYFYDSKTAAFEFFSAYFTEYALSIDNIFVIILILRYFKVEEQYYHKVLFWGILGAIVMRAIFIFVGAFLIHRFHAILYIFGAFLLYSGIRMLLHEDDSKELDTEGNPIIRFARRYLPFTHQEHGARFWVREQGKLYFTPLFLVILLIESTDLLFAVDSIPAAFVISQNEFVVYTSNIFAVMGLRAMFFLLSGVLDRFYLLQRGLSIILIFIGLKMLLEMTKYIGLEIHIPTAYSLLTIIGILAGSIVLSVLYPRKDEPENKD